MRIETRKIFTFDELDDETKQVAYENNIRRLSIVYNDFKEEETLKRFCEFFNVKLKDYSIYEYNYDYDFEISYTDETNTEDMDSMRLAKYVYNNYYVHLLKGKYYCINKYIDGKYTYKHRYSNINKSWDGCVFTGMCFDIDILEPISNCVDYKVKYDSFKNLIDACLDSLFKTWQRDIEYENSYEFYAEMAVANEWEYYEDGTLV